MAADRDESFAPLLPETEVIGGSDTSLDIHMEMKPARRPQRKEVYWYHSVGDFFNCLKSFIGTNYQALPFAFHNSGLALGLIGVFCIAALTDHCVQLLIRCKNVIIKQVSEAQVRSGEIEPSEQPILERRLQQTMGYGDVGNKALGPWCAHVIQFAVWFTQFMTVMSYYIFIGNTVYEIFPTYPVPYIIHNGTHPEVGQLVKHHRHGVPMLHIHNIEPLEDTWINISHLTANSYPSRVKRQFDTPNLQVEFVEPWTEFSEESSWMIDDFTGLPYEAVTESYESETPYSETHKSSRSYSELYAISEQSNHLLADTSLSDIQLRNGYENDMFDTIPESSTTSANTEESTSLTTSFIKNTTTSTVTPTSSTNHTTDSPVTPTSSSNHTTESPVTPTSGSNSTTDGPPAPTESPSFYHRSSSPDLRLVILFPLPFFLVTSLMRKVRYFGPFSVIATAALAGGAFAVLGFIIVNFKVSDFEWYKFKTLPLFLGQLIGAYEGIGCVIPIQSSMEGNRHLFPCFVHSAVTIVFFILCSFGALGYVTYGEAVEQIIVLNIPQHSVLSIIVDITLIISVLFTYPLQCFPVIDILEIYIFSKGKCCGRHDDSPPEYQEIGQDSPHSLEDSSSLLQEVERSVEASANELSGIIPASVPAWKRNVLRVLLTLILVGIAILLKDAYAYTAAVTGALGASLLSFILPCVIHLSLCYDDLSKAGVVKDVFIIVIAVITSVTTCIAIIMKTINSFSNN